MGTIRAYPMKTNINIPAHPVQIGKAKPISSFARLIRRFRYFILETDWDKDLLRCKKWGDLLCWAIIVASVLFFLPVTLSVVCK